MMSRWFLLMSLLTACGDGNKAAGDGKVDTNIVSIRVEPASADLVANLDAAAEMQFTAFATTDKGEEFETDMVTWETSNLSAGTIDETGLFTASVLNGGVTVVSATHVGIADEATITIIYEADIVGSGVDSALVNAFASAAPSDGDLPALSYPLDGVNVPRNLEGLAFQWDLPDSANVVRIRMSTDITDIRIHVSGNDWMSNADLWSLIVASNTEGSVNVRIESGVWDGSDLSDVQRGPRSRLTVNRLDARGSVLYWVARANEAGVGGQGTGDIMRIPFGSTEAEIFWAAEDSNGECIGCHTLTERANRMVITHHGVNGTFSILDVTDPDNPTIIVEPVEEQRVTFHALSPDGQYMLGVADKVAKLYSMTDGALLQTLDTEGYTVSHPAWSPDGEDILLVRATSTWFSDTDFEGGEIIQIPFNSGDWGETQVLVERSDSVNNYYPAYSPDGEWIAFNRAVATEITLEGMDPRVTSTSKANPSAELWLMRRDGSDQTRLNAANGEGEQQNSFPRWGPLPDDDVLWLAYSSTRSYSVDPNRGLPQIWVTAIDPNKMESGADPSSSPFWLPGQDAQSDNHLPVWWSK